MVHRGRQLVSMVLLGKIGMLWIKAKSWLGRESLYGISGMKAQGHNSQFN